MHAFTHAGRMVALTLGLAAFSSQAMAHAHLRSATPAPDSTIASAPGELDLQFSEDLNLAFTGVTLLGPGKTAVTTGKARLGAERKSTLVVPVSGTLAAGPYRVDWHALSTDGHKTSGSYRFIVKP